MTVIMADDDSIDDDVFETKETTPSANLDVNQSNAFNASNPSPTGYRNYQPPAEVLRMCEMDYIEESEQIVHKVRCMSSSLSFKLERIERLTVSIKLRIYIKSSPNN